MPLELQTKWLVSCNGFVKVDSDKVNFFNREKQKENKISKDDLEELRKMEEILNRPSFNN